ncbi:MAG: class I SAM-dependent methyltransferase [Sedimentisphaerales bacterium]|nr:class I SAM-dependent methyltransferase [Sedimentisphaerales bacterium]
MKLHDFKYVYVDDWVLHGMKGKSVLHLGCVGDHLAEGPKACMHVKISEVADTLWGVDIDSSGLDKVRAWLPEDRDRIRYFCGNVENLQCLAIDRKFEVIFAGSIIEHLSNPGLMISEFKDLLSPDGVVIIVTPHSFGLLQYLRVALRRKEAVNPQHCCYFSASVLSELCSRYGLVPVDWYTGYGYRKPSLKISIERAFGVPFFRVFPHLGGSLIGTFKLLKAAKD